MKTTQRSSVLMAVMAAATGMTGMAKGLFGGREKAAPPKGHGTKQDRLATPPNTGGGRHCGSTNKKSDSAMRKRKRLRKMARAARRKNRHGGSHQRCGVVTTKRRHDTPPHRLKKPVMA